MFNYLVNTRVKFLRSNLTHHCFKYKEGLNVDYIQFNPTGNCKPGGLYYTDLIHMDYYSGFGTKLAYVEVPDDAKTYQESNAVVDEVMKWKSDRIILNNIGISAGHPAWGERDLLLNLLYNNYSAELIAKDRCLDVAFIKEQLKLLRLEAVKQNGLVLGYIDDQTEEICMEAVRQNTFAYIYMLKIVQKIYKSYLNL